MSTMHHQFRWPDYLVLAMVLMLSLSIGLYHGCRQKGQNTINNYLLANRRMSWIPVGLSILVTFQSAILFTGVPGEVYRHGISYVIMSAGKTLAVGVVIVYIVPLLFPLKLTSTYEYLERRFKSRTVRILGSFIGALYTILYMGICLYAPAIAMTAVSDVPVWTVIVVLSLVATLYTALGGMRAVIWTDVFQFLVMFSGILALVIEGFREQGGAARVWEICTSGARLGMPGFSVDPRVRHSVWSLIIGGAFTWLASIGVTQSNVQRLSSVPTMKDAGLALLITIPGFAIWNTLAGVIGLIIYAHYHTAGCDPIAGDIITSPNQLSTLYAAEVFSFLPGFPGLFVASIFSASLSTVSSGVNGLAAMFWEDVLKWKLGHVTEKTRTGIVKICAFTYGLISMGMAFLMVGFGGPATQIAVSLIGASGGPLFGMFLLGSLFPCANWIGVSVGAVSSVSVSMWIAVSGLTFKSPKPLPPAPVLECPLVANGSDVITSTVAAFTQWPANDTDTDMYLAATETVLTSIYRISYLWYSLIGVVLVLSVGLIVSAITGPTQMEDIEPELLSGATKWLVGRCHGNDGQPMATKWKRNDLEPTNTCTHSTDVSVISNHGLMTSSTNMRETTAL